MASKKRKVWGMFGKVVAVENVPAAVYYSVVQPFIDVPRAGGVWPSTPARTLVPTALSLSASGPPYPR